MQRRCIVMKRRRTWAGNRFVINHFPSRSRAAGKEHQPPPSTVMSKGFTMTSQVKCPNIFQHYDKKNWRRRVSESNEQRFNTDSGGLSLSPRRTRPRMVSGVQPRKLWVSRSMLPSVDSAFRFNQSQHQRWWLFHYENIHSNWCLLFLFILNTGHG